MLSKEQREHKRIESEPFPNRGWVRIIVLLRQPVITKRGGGIVKFLLVRLFGNRRTPKMQVHHLFVPICKQAKQNVTLTSQSLPDKILNAWRLLCRGLGAKSMTGGAV